MLPMAYPSLSREPSTSFDSTDEGPSAPDADREPLLEEPALAGLVLLPPAPSPPSLLLKLLLCLTRCRSVLGTTSSDRCTLKAPFSLRPKPILRFRPDVRNSNVSVSFLLLYIRFLIPRLLIYILLIIHSVSHTGILSSIQLRPFVYSVLTLIPFQFISIPACIFIFSHTMFINISYQTVIR